MFRINFYPEYAAKRRRARQRVLWTALLAVVLALEAALLAALTTSGILLQERARYLRSQTEQIAAALPDLPPDNIDLALELLAKRRERIDWTPKLAALSAVIHDDVRLSEIIGQTPWRRQAARLEVNGVIRGARARMEDIARFADALKSESMITDDFPHVRVARLGSEADFRIVCELAQQQQQRQPQQGEN
jgi:hypothetical protein